MGYIYEITMMSGEAGLNFEARQLEEEDFTQLDYSTGLPMQGATRVK